MKKLNDKKQVVAQISAAALDTGAVSKNSSFYCGESISVAGTRFHCANHKRHGAQTVTQALENSCNQSFIQIGARLGKEAFCDYFAAFGLRAPIGIAAVVASEFNVPVVFAKKSMSINLDYDNYETKIQSFTHKKIYNVIVSKKFLTPEDHVLIIDDFLANGCALLGLLELTEKAGATVEHECHIIVLHRILS